MRRSSGWSVAVALALTMFVAVAGAQAQTIVDVPADGAFTGTIATVGADVQARFYATAGAALQLKVQANRGATLRPSVVIRNAAGMVVAGQTQRINWMPTGNLIHYATAPADGMYTATIGSLSGSGGFWARLSGHSPAPQMTLLSGTVRDASTNAPIVGATVLVDAVAFDITDASGAYSGQLAFGTYSVTFQAFGYDDANQMVALSGPSFVLDVTLDPIVIATTISASVSGTPDFGADMTASVAVQTAPGVTVTGIQWTQVWGTPVTLAGATTATCTATLGDITSYKDELIHVLSEPPIGENQLPPNVPVPEGEFPGGLQDRLQVVGLNHFVLEEAGLVVLEVEVTTTDGVYTDQVEIHVDQPWPVSTGLRNVPVGAPVLLHAVEAASYDWTLQVPPGSLATLTDATTQTPYFTPDINGLYELEISDGMGGPTSTLEVYAGTFRGVIVGQDMNGRPVSDTACTFCHNDVFAADKFTPWEETGHAEIFTANLDNSSYYGTRCFGCHVVGYDLQADNEGADEASDYQQFVNAGLLGNPGDNWTTVLAQFPETARKANIQCENCHGPQDSNAHGFAGPLGAPRESLSANVCASCHGEPLRHARFQQWQLSGHANYELADREGDSGNCSRCHTANGFLAWLPVLLGDQPGDPLDSVSVTWEPEDVHPQTCVTCHDPHDAGTSSGNDPDVNIRISGDTPPLIGGFQATDVGRGAVCMTCHNSRRGLRNDSVFDAFSQSEKARAPHGGSQGDMLMGQNAYLIPVDARGGHSMTGDTCVDCHMKETPPPADLAYNSGGANHTFYAEKTICSNCHSPHLLASDVQNAIQALLGQVEEFLIDAYYDVLGDQTGAGYSIDFNGDIVVDDVADITRIVVGTSRGRQAMGVTVAGVDYGPYRLQDIDVLDGTGSTLVDVTDDGTLKAGWNYHLVLSDGSLGVHNPFFANGALIAARDALIARLTGGAMPLKRSGPTLSDSLSGKLKPFDKPSGPPRRR